MRWNCAERGCFNMSLPSWDDLLECFPRDIRPTDIDGMVEINGHVLILDQKGPGKGFEEGQRRAYQALRDRPKTTIVGFRDGESSELEVIVLAHDLPGTGWQPVTRQWLRDWLREWAIGADRDGTEAVAS
jgi:hypothetical protein